MNLFFFKQFRILCLILFKPSFCDTSPRNVTAQVDLAQLGSHVRVMEKDAGSGSAWTGRIRFEDLTVVLWSMPIMKWVTVRQRRRLRPAERRFCASHLSMQGEKMKTVWEHSRRLWSESAVAFVELTLCAVWLLTQNFGQTKICQQILRNISATYWSGREQQNQKRKNFTELEVFFNPPTCILTIRPEIQKSVADT